MRAKHIFSPALLLAVVLPLTGCVKLWSERVDRKTYLISAERSLPVCESVGGVLWIDRVNVLPPFNVRSFIVRKGETEYASNYYRELLISPSENVRNVFYSWFDASGLFAETTVHDRRALTHRLSVTLLEMVSDDSAGPPRRAVVALKASLIKSATGAVLLHKTYRQAVAAEDGSDEADVAALCEAFRLILEACEKDVASVLEEGENGLAD